MIIAGAVNKFIECIDSGDASCTNGDCGRGYMRQQAVAIAKLVNGGIVYLCKECVESEPNMEILYQGD